MSIVYQKLSKKELPWFIEMRINQLRADGTFLLWKSRLISAVPVEK